MTTVMDSYRDDLPPIDRAAGVSWLGPLPLLLLGVTPGVIALVATEEASIWVGLTLLWYIVVGSLADDSSRLGWLVPPIIRAAEYGFVIGLTWWTDTSSMSAAFALLAALSFHHYNLVYRQRYQPTPLPTWLLIALGGWQVRMALVFVLAAADSLTPGLWLMAGWVGVLAVGESMQSWQILRSDRTSAMESDDDVLD